MRPTKRAPVWRGLVCPINEAHGQLVDLPRRENDNGRHWHCPHSDHTRSAPMVNPTERTIFTLDEAETGTLEGARE